MTTKECQKNARIENMCFGSTVGNLPADFPVDLATGCGVECNPM